MQRVARSGRCRSRKLYPPHLSDDPPDALLLTSKQFACMASEIAEQAECEYLLAKEGDLDSPSFSGRPTTAAQLQLISLSDEGKTEKISRSIDSWQTDRSLSSYPGDTQIRIKRSITGGDRHRYSMS